MRINAVTREQTDCFEGIVIRDDGTNVNKAELYKRDEASSVGFNLNNVVVFHAEFEWRVVGRQHVAVKEITPAEHARPSHSIPYNGGLVALI